jgi:hypothetical protein
MSGLPRHPDPDQLRRQARELLRAATAGEPQALARLRAYSERVTLSAAQLAIAREHGFPSWPALQAEAARLRRALTGRPTDPGAWWSLGGAGALTAVSGELAPLVLLVGPGQAVLEASLLASPGTLTVPGDVPSFDDLTITDNGGKRYRLAIEGASIPPEVPGREREPASVSLRVRPVPVRGCEWIELRNTGGAAARLELSARPDISVSELTPARPAGPEGRDELVATQRAGGQRFQLDLPVALPPVDGTTVQPGTLISESRSWQLHARAWPGWWVYSRDGHYKRQAVTVRAEDDLGGTYPSSFGGSVMRDDHEGFALRFSPGLDPAARTLTLTFAGTAEQVTVTIPLPQAALAATR